MNVGPVIHRELRAEARHAFTYWLRVLGAAALLAVFAVTMIDQGGSTAQLGAKLFGNLNATLFVAIWILVPLLTADCLSRERREGTLGLLLLTPLSSRGVVIGKSLIHGLRAAALLLTALPVLTVPILIGGVEWREGLVALMLDSGAVLLALGTGLVASACCKEWSRALLLAEAFSFISLLGFGFVSGFAFFTQVLVPFVPVPGPLQIHFNELIELGLVAVTGVSGWRLTVLLPGWVHAWLWTTGEIFLFSVLNAALLVFWTARRVKRTWREEPLSRRQPWWRQLLFAPRFWKSVLRSKMERALERNPVGWLQQRTAIARIIKWGWLFFVIILEALALSDGRIGWRNDFAFLQHLLLVALVLSLAATAAGSFRQERQNGALELMLVTPLSEEQIILGRLCGVWGQFVPVAGMLAALWTFLLQSELFEFWPGYSDHYNYLDSAFALLTMACFVSIPVVGLYFSLTRKHFLAAWLLTLAVCLALPGCAVGGRGLLFEYYTNSAVGMNGSGGELVEALGSMAVIQILLAAVAGWLLYHNLRFRKFTLMA